MMGLKSRPFKATALAAVDGDGLEDDGCLGAVHAVAGDLADLLDDIVTLGDFAEDGVLAGEPAGIRDGDEELRAVGVGSGVRHGKLAGLLEGLARGLGFVGELVAGAAHAGALRVAALDHELGDDAVEDGAVVKLVALLAGGVPFLGAFSEADKVSDGFRSFGRKQLADDGAFGGLESSGGRHNWVLLLMIRLYLGCAVASCRRQPRPVYTVS